ncbi:hypothetical protein Daus18300_004510, partial [Diaporthe australafricana]
MEKTTPVDATQPTVQQMFAVLLEEMASLRKQNEEQQRQLDHLRNDTGILLGEAKKSQNASGFSQFTRLPLEIRRMIWRLAVPSRMLGLEHATKDKNGPVSLSVPAVARVCRESREVLLSRDCITELSGRHVHLSGPSQLWRLGVGKLAHWTWFTPDTDVLLVNKGNFSDWHYGVAPTAKHIVIDCRSVKQWRASHRPGGLFPDLGGKTDVVDRLLCWLKGYEPNLACRPDSGVDPAYNLRTVDLAMNGVTKIDRNYPPNVVHCLFAGEDFRVVDLRDEEDVRRIELLMGDSDDHHYFPYPDISRETADIDDSNLLSFKTDLLRNLVLGRAGQTLLAYISWKTFSKCLYSAMMTDPVTYQTFWAVFMEDGPSLRSILRTFRDFVWRRGLRSKLTMLLMIFTMSFVLAFPTLASAMTGYSANNEAVVKTDDVNQVPFSQFQEVRFIIHDFNRVSQSMEPMVISSRNQDYLVCGGSSCIKRYISKYGIAKNITSIWNGEPLESPTLNITSYSDKPGGMTFVFKNKTYDTTYFTANDRTICQPAIENSQQTYQWGFSALQLEISICLLTLWTLSIYTMWITAYLQFTSMGIEYKAPGNLKAAMSLADAIRKDFNENHDKDVETLTKQELISYTRTHLNGGEVTVQSPPPIPDQSAWKVIWKWVMQNKAWTVAFALVSLSWVFYAVTSFLWLTMVFSMVA